MVSSYFHVQNASSGRQSRPLSFVITNVTRNARRSPVRPLARLSGRVVWPGECPCGTGQLSAAGGRHNCLCAVPAVKQAPRGCRHQFGGRRSDCLQGGGQGPVQQGGPARGSGRWRPGDGHRFPPPGGADGTRLFFAVPVPMCYPHMLQPAALACQVGGYGPTASHAHHCASGAYLQHPRATAPSTPVPPLTGWNTSVRCGRNLKSQTKSQRPPSSGHDRLQPASITASRLHIRQRPAPSRAQGCAPYKRGFTGSNPVAPTRQNSQSAILE